jgi:hypothetical protein
VRPIVGFGDKREAVLDGHAEIRDDDRWRVLGEPLACFGG